MPDPAHTSRNTPITANLPVRAFRSALLKWFDAHQRVLPWRMDHGPYRVWVSEIMLQQTRVAAVLDHYKRFMKRFPDVQTLARARSATVLAHWSGLGYYRRARMLHQAARQIACDLNGIFPTSAGGWRELPGIGRYTAAAIASICYGERCAVVDGNVKRVFARLLGSEPSDYWKLADTILSPSRPGDFNQAMMELGALVCTPKSPGCKDCPVGKWCAVSQSGTSRQVLRPQRKKKTITLQLLTNSDHLLLIRREDSAGVMAGMWELPALAPPPASVTPDLVVRHAIMDTDYLVHVFRSELQTKVAVPNTAQIPFRRLAILPLTGLTRKILKRTELI